MSSSKPQANKRRISDFFVKIEEKRKREEKEQQSTSEDVQSLKCPKRKVLVADDETDGLVVGNSGNENRGARRRKRNTGMRKLEKNQMVLDCGQAVIGSKTCSDCGMVYSVDDADDVKHHQKFHDEHMGRLEIPKTFIDLISTFHVRDNGKYKVFYVGTFADDAFKNIIRKHMTTINKQLGYTANDDVLWTQERRIFMILMTVFEDTPERRMYIGGICVVEKLSEAFTSETSMIIGYGDEKDDWIVGVDRIWVSPECRRLGVAMALLDAATTQDRQMEYRPRRLRIAFSDPSDDGKKLAHAFTQTRYLPDDRFEEEFLVY